MYKIKSKNKKAFYKPRANDYKKKTRARNAQVA